MLNDAQADDAQADDAEADDAEADDAQASDAARLMVCVVPPLHWRERPAARMGR